MPETTPETRPLVVIPARMAATRLPGKPLADIAGTPMIIHVLRRAEAAGIGPVIVACGDTEIADVVAKAGGHAVMTDPDLPSGSDRAMAAADEFDPGGAHDVIVNLQGDLPAIDPAILVDVLTPLADPGTDIATLVAATTDPAEAANPNVVKAVVAMAAGARTGPALYFSRAATPSGDGPLYHHIGIYAFRRTALARFVSLPQGVLEQREKLEQLRALENGMRIGAALVDGVPFGVDTPEDLERARQILGN